MCSVRSVTYVLGRSHYVLGRSWCEKKRIHASGRPEGRLSPLPIVIQLRTGQRRLGSNARNPGRKKNRLYLHSVRNIAACSERNPSPPQMTLHSPFPPNGAASSRGFSGPVG